MNTRKHWKRQLARVEHAIDLMEANGSSGPLIDREKHHDALAMLQGVRNGLRRELGIAPTAAERRERL